MKIGLASDEILLDEFSLLEELSKKVEIQFIDLKNFSFKSPEETRSLINSYGIEAIVNRATSKNFRENSTENFEKADILVINPYGVEYFSNSKPRLKDIFRRYRIPTIDSILIQDFPIKKYGDRFSLNRNAAEKISKLIFQEWKKAVIKPTEGSRGKAIFYIESEKDFLRTCVTAFQNYKDRGKINEALFPCLSNPYGVYAEEFKPHALDLRISLEKEKGKSPVVIGCLARVVSSDEIIAKNTALGAIPIGIPTPPKYEKIAVECINALVNFTRSRGFNIDALYGGIDIIPVCEDGEERKKIYEGIKKLSKFKTEKIEPVKTKVKVALEKRLENRCTEGEFNKTLREHDQIYAEFKSLPEYLEAQSLILEHLDKCTPYANEFNTRPDFRNNTHNLSANIPESIYRVLKSIVA
ncbi:MAG: hypothetical protein QXU74_00295 [Candidatus Aenigmatarchaeota archaeon]